MTARVYPRRATMAAAGSETTPYARKNANVVSMDCAYVRLKTVFTDAMRGSIIDVMNPQAKNRVVTAARAADRSRFVDGISFRSLKSRVRSGHYQEPV